MGNFLSGLGFGLALSTRCNYSGFGFGYGYGFGGLGYGYDGVPSTAYLQTCFCDFDQPSGLNSLVDNGWAVNYSYRCNPFSSSNYSCYSPFGSYGYGGLGLGLGMGLGLGFYC